MASSKKTSSDSIQDSTTQEKTKQTSADLGQAEMQRQADKEAAQGFVGIEVDETDNFNYTLAGVTSGAPTPETDKGDK